MSTVSPSLCGSPCSPSTTPPLDACTQHLRALSVVLQSLVEVRGGPGGSERMLADLLSCCGNALQDVTREVESRASRRRGANAAKEALADLNYREGAVNSFANIIAAFTVTLQLILEVTETQVFSERPQRLSPQIMHHFQSPRSNSALEGQVGGQEKAHVGTPYVAAVKTTTARCRIVPPSVRVSPTEARHSEATPV
ncbi:hypothetical protein Purlil1_11820 [Purpureocillium lilacinum]|uniref:Azaphilone pigments biosynthesis cluster protein L N-terminal domain-containing protein n=1 Tax=Purpureocillium lilacinum TaxID=33203 RepID=A0ABR0BIN2_PURLI|nr:hypothetical protein Purlil1_11820 [Purpureocillium lilacinum]